MNWVQKRSTRDMRPLRYSTLVELRLRAPPLFTSKSGESGSSGVPASATSSTSTTYWIVSPSKHCVRSSVHSTRGRGCCAAAVAPTSDAQVAISASHLPVTVHRARHDHRVLRVLGLVGLLLGALDRLAQ